MKYLFTNAWKIMGVFAILLALSLTGCTENDNGITVSGTGNEFILIESNSDDASDAPVVTTDDSVDNSVEALPVE